MECPKERIDTWWSLAGPQAKGVPQIYWGKCIRTAAYLHNKTPSSAISNKTLYEMLHKRVPDVGHLQVFGCVCYVHLPEPSKGKLEKKAVKCVFVGYSTERKGWRCIEPSTRRVVESRDVVFDEGGVGSQQREGTYIKQQPQFDRKVGGRTAKGKGRRSFRSHVTSEGGADAITLCRRRVLLQRNRAALIRKAIESGVWRTGVHVEGAERPVPRTCEERQKKTGVVQKAAPQGSSTSPVEPARKRLRYRATAFALGRSSVAC